MTPPLRVGLYANGSSTQITKVAVKSAVQKTAEGAIASSSAVTPTAARMATMALQGMRPGWDAAAAAALASRLPRATPSW